LTNFLISRYTLAFSDGYNNYYGPADVVSSDDTSYDNTIQWSNSFTTSLSRQFNRLGFNLKYNRLDYRYRGDAAFQSNYYQNTYAFEQTFSISKKTEFLFGYDYSNIRYNHDLGISKNYFYDQYRLELTKVLTPKITGLLSAIYKNADYKDQNDYKEGIYKANLSYQPSLRTNFSFLYQHTPHDSPEKDNYTIDNTYKFSLIYRPVFSSNIQLNLSYQAQFIDYPKQEDPGDNDTYTWNFTLNYFFRQWLDFSLNYYNKQNKGSVATKYMDNVITLKTQARF